MEEKLTYEEAAKRLEVIVAQIESGNLDIDKLGEKLKEAQQLIALCKERLYKTDEEIKKILEENS